VKKISILLIFIAAIVICYYYVDRRVIYALSSHNSRQFLFLKIFANDIIAILVSLIALAYLYMLLGYILNKKFFTSALLFTLSHRSMLPLFLLLPQHSSSCIQNGVG
jgi:hypothetical protein